MRESDRKLRDALVAAGLDHLAERAARGEWNDYFGRHPMPQHHLVMTLRATAGDTVELQRRVIRGEFDGTAEEANEWACSPEGRATLAELGLEGRG
jgi:hypothetical protein